MKRGTPRDLDYQTRYGQMNAQHSIQDVYDLLVELITNCDDSYHDLFRENLRADDGGPILLEVERHRGGRSSIVSVGDKAAGFKNLNEAIQKVGKRTSKSGDRGFMARGLKDCAALGHVTVESIRDGFIQKAEITSAFKFIPYEPTSRRGDLATDPDRKRLGIGRGNGTVVKVELEPRVPVPLLGTLAKELPWHYALRDVMREDGPSKVLLRESGGRPQPLSHVQPESALIHDEEYVVPGYDFRARLKLFKATSALEDPPDKCLRRTGVLVKGRRGIYACTFFTSELERDPAAEGFFGILQCEGIDALAEEWDDRREGGEPHPAANPILILDPNRRTGLTENHPFTKALFAKPIALLREQFEKDREDAKRSRQEVEAKETTDRLKRLAREASRFMQEKLEDLGTVSPTDTVSSKAYMEKGVGLVPTFTQIPIGEEKLFQVKVSEKLDLPLGTVVKPILSKKAEACLQLVGEAVDLEPDPVHEGLLRGSFRLKAVAEGRVQIGCQVDAKDPVYGEVQVVSATPVDLEIPNDFAFHRKAYTVKEGAQRKLLLRARFSPPPEEPPSVKLHFSDPKTVVLRSRQGFELVLGTTYYEAAFQVEGSKLHGKARVTATVGDKVAHCDVAVVPREEEGVDLEFKLVSYSLGQNYRAVWDRAKPSRLLITTQHESVSRYLGKETDDYPGQHGDAFRVLLAELISDNVCRRIVEEHARTLPGDFDSDKIYVLHNRLMREFTPIAHRIQLATPQTVAGSSRGSA